jgi:membrane-bound ClpP family serine protease
MAAFPASAADQAVCDGKLASQARPPALVLSWTGKIRDPMAECIQGAFDRLAGSTRYIVLNLDSEGGSLLTTDRVIASSNRCRRRILCRPSFATAENAGRHAFRCSWRDESAMGR